MDDPVVNRTVSMDQVRRVLDLVELEMGLTASESMVVLVCTMWHLCNVNDIGVEDGLNRISRSFRSIEAFDLRQ
jgi:hypothetical protein